MINGFVFASLSNSKNATTVTTYNCVCFFFGKNLNIFNLIFLFFNCHSRVSGSIWLYAIFCLLSSFCVCTLAINIFSNFYLAERLCEFFFYLYTMSTQRTFAELLNKFDLFIRVTCCVFIRFGSCFSFMLWTFAFFLVTSLFLFAFLIVLHLDKEKNEWDKKLGHFENLCFLPIHWSQFVLRQIFPRKI